MHCIHFPDAWSLGEALSTKFSTSSLEAHEERWIERLEHLFRQDGNQFSYRPLQVAEQSSKVVGLILSFGGRDEPGLNVAIG